MTDRDDLLDEVESLLEVDEDRAKEIGDLLELIRAGVEEDLRHAAAGGVAGDLTVATMKTEIITLRAYVEAFSKVLVLNKIIGIDALGDLMIFALRGEASILGEDILSRLVPTDEEAVN